MKPNNSVITASAFLGMLEQGKGRAIHATVQGDVTIERGERSYCYDFDNVTFIGRVTIRNHTSIQNSISIQGSNFLAGLRFERNDLRHISIQDCEAECISFRHCSFETGCISRTKVKTSLDISGLSMKGHLHIVESTFRELKLMHDSAYDTVKTPMLHTDDPIVACQFHLLGIPVIMSTQSVRKFLASQKQEEDPLSLALVGEFGS